MDRNVNYVVVGSFVVVVLCMMFGFILWLVGSHDARSYDFYTVKFSGAISGVSVGGKVSYLGVEVGEVLEIRLNPNEPDAIRVDIEIDQDTPVNVGTKATLKPQGITGLSLIEISTQNINDAKLEKMEEERYPLIHASGSDLDKILSDFPQITMKAIKLIDRLNLALSDDNLENISSILDNVDALSVDLNGLLSEDNVFNVATTLSNAAILSEDAKNLITELEIASQNFASTTKRINNILKKNEDSIEHFTGQSLNEVSLLINESRDMVRSVKRLTDKIGDDPSRLIYKPKYKGVKINP